MKLTTITKIMVGVIALALVLFCVVLLPELAREEAAGRANPPSSLPYFIASLYTIPIFVALWQTYKLLNFMDHNQAFSEASVRALKIIKYCAATFAVMVVVGAIALVVSAKMIDPSEDVAPVGPISAVLVFICTVIATFVAVLQRLVRNAIDMKSENDLIV